MMDRLSNPAKIKAFYLAEEIKSILKDLYLKHMDDIESGEFSRVMMEDWANGDVKLHTWRENYAKSAFENAPACDTKISEQEYFDKGTFTSCFLLRLVFVSIRYWPSRYLPRVSLLRVIT